MCTEGKKISKSVEVINKIKDLNDINEIKRIIQENQAAIDSENNLWQSEVRKCFTIIAIVLVIAFIFTVFKFSSNWTLLPAEVKVPKKDETGLKYDFLDVVFYGLWIIGPPLWFLYEYVNLFGKNPAYRLDTNQRDDMKYCQDLASKIWAAVAVFLSILLSIKYGLIKF